MSLIEAENAEAAGADAGEGRDAATIGVLVKAFRALEVVAEIGEPMPLRDIAKATGLPKGTLFRILQTLTTLGYAAQVEETGFYYLTGRLSWLGRNAREDDLKMLALPVMKALHEEFNETINLGVLEGTYVYYVAVLEAERPLSWRVPTGTRDTYYSTALGRAIAAHLEPPQREALIGHTDLRSRTAHTIKDKAELGRILDAVQEKGVAVDLEENDDGVVCLGVPIFLGGRVAASISVSVPTNRYSAPLGEALTARLQGLALDFPAPD
ncbi:IclR family transcriptional regulator [Pseudoroseicyclus tamaricis]|uniref:IclR family transcriptional regulator n=1 Tax=Pseudoroseicyclus tamaricis TaxID=2705421 RepID=A0A6B2JUH8_9RHOB|nr:IclR family transcriptional regulator [Pseudoroseicyclus tamaricis]NDV00269.1 IclR family transcriptional regulator [Pseudoroseicyclus tamaricis]